MKRAIIAAALGVILSGCHARPHPRPHTGSDHSFAYPSRAWELNLKGEVTAIYDVDNSGRVVNVRIIKETYGGLFSESVKNTLYSWKFKPEQAGKDNIVLPTVQN